MPNVEVTNEPAPAYRGGSKTGMFMTVRLIDSKTGKQVGECKAEGRRNERVPREERKY